MLMNSLEYARENDIIVLSPEYHQFYHNRANGEIELLYMIFDVPETMKKINVHQYLNLVKYLPDYMSSKLKFWDSLKELDTTIVGVYDRKSFNSYGDAYIHWTLPKQFFEPAEMIDGSINKSVFSFLNSFSDLVYSHKAKFYITFPGYQDISFDNSKKQINLIYEKLKTDGFILLGTPERYRMPDSLMFDAAYHPTKKGVDLRTSLIIEDLKRVINLN